MAGLNVPCPCSMHVAVAWWQKACRTCASLGLSITSLSAFGFCFVGSRPAPPATARASAALPVYFDFAGPAPRESPQPAPAALLPNVLQMCHLLHVLAKLLVHGMCVLHVRVRGAHGRPQSVSARAPASLNSLRDARSSRGPTAGAGQTRRREA